MMTADIGISFGWCQAIFMGVLIMKRTAAKIVPKLLNFEQEQRSMDIVQKILTKFNESLQKRQYWKKHVKFEQMWRFCSLFSSIAIAWFNMNSCHKVVRSIRNATMKLWANCAKQFVKNAQNCGKTNHGFRIMIMHQFTHRCLCVGLWPKTKS